MFGRRRRKTSPAPPALAGVTSVPIEVSQSLTYMTGGGVKVADLDTSAWTEAACAAAVSTADVTPGLVLEWVADTADLIMRERGQEETGDASG